MNPQQQKTALDPATERRIVDAITKGLEPVRPLGPSWRYVLAIVAAAVLIAVIGIWMRGTQGWSVDTLAQKSYFTAALAAGIAMAAITLSRLMVPGTLLAVTPRAIVLFAVALVAGGACLYPVAHYNRFGAAASACFGIGMRHAALASVLMFFIVRRGAFLSRTRMALIIGLAGGLTAVIVLYVFCPHRDLGHFSLGHTTVPLAAVAAGALIGRMLR
jgi:hypothetical protein